MNKPVAKEDMEMLTDPAFRIGEPFPFLSGPFLSDPFLSVPIRSIPVLSYPFRSYPFTTSFAAHLAQR